MMIRLRRTTRFAGSRFAAAALVSAVMIVAGSTLGAAVVVPASLDPFVPGRTAPPTVTTGTVTADQLGPGSMVAVVATGNFEKMRSRGLKRSLLVITPDGVTHTLYSVELSRGKNGLLKGDVQLADWRPDLHVALLHASVFGEDHSAIALDVTTGSTRTVQIPDDIMSVGLAPDGAGLLVAAYPTRRHGGKTGTMTWEGDITWQTAKTDGSGITSPDGSTAVFSEGSHERWWVVDLATNAARTVSTPGDCSPRRWMDETSLMATCFDRRGTQLDQITLDGAVTPLGIRLRTTSSGFRGPSWGDTDVRFAQGRAYYESNGPCGGSFLTKQTPAGRVKMVRVPNATDGISLLGSRGEDLVIAHTETCDSRPPRAVLGLFNPVTHKEQVISTLGRRDRWTAVHPADDTRQWSW